MRIRAGLMLITVVVGFSIGVWIQAMEMKADVTPPDVIETGADTGDDDALRAVYEAASEELQREVEHITGEAIGIYGVYFKYRPPDLDAELTVKVESDRAFYVASCYKLPLVLHLYEEAAAGRVELAERMIYAEEHFATGAGLLQKEEFGGSYDLEYLAHLAIVHSDNAASRMLLDRLGRSEFQAYQEGIGARESSMRDMLASPRDLGLFLHRARVQAETDPHHYGVIITWMTQAQPRDRIPRAVPTGVPVASKTGTWPGTMNDAAIILLEDAEALLVVMSEGVPSYEDSMTVITDIARTLYLGIQRLEKR